LGSSRDVAIGAFVTSADGYDIKLALEWANQMEAPDSRATRVEDTARRWLREDDAAARAWLVRPLVHGQASSLVSNSKAMHLPDVAPANHLGIGGVGRNVDRMVSITGRERWWSERSPSETAENPADIRKGFGSLLRQHSSEKSTAADHPPTRKPGRCQNQSPVQKRGSHNMDKGTAPKSLASLILRSHSCGALKWLNAPDELPPPENQ